MKIHPYITTVLV